MNISELNLKKEDFFNTEAGGYYISDAELDYIAQQTETADNRRLHTEKTYES